MFASLFSGGKDSTLAVHRMSEQGRKVDLLITMYPDNAFSYMFHKQAINMTPMQAEALGIRHAVYRTKGEKEEELKDLERALTENEVTELVTGAVASTYQKGRIERMCERLGITLHGPLWGIDPLAELGELSARFNAIVTQVAAEGFDDSFLGARIDGRMIEKLKVLHAKYRINMLFEGGEAESLVLDGPLFKKRIAVKEAHKEWEGPVGRYTIDKAVLEEK